MSKNFEIPESKRNKNKQAVHQLDTDALEGLRQAAQNGQPALAVRYAVYAIDIIDTWMTEVNNKLAAIESAATKTVPKVKTVEAE